VGETVKTLVEGVLDRCLGRLAASQEREKGEVEDASRGRQQKVPAWALSLHRRGEGGLQGEATEGPSPEASGVAGPRCHLRLPWGAEACRSREGSARGEVLATAVTVGVSWLEKQRQVWHCLLNPWPLPC